MDKKQYCAPEVKRVRLDINSAVLAVCHSSTISDDALLPGGCRTPNCYDGAPQRES